MNKEDLEFHQFIALAQAGLYFEEKETMTKQTLNLTNKKSNKPSGTSDNNMPHAQFIAYGQIGHYFHNK